jgi:hypothetical protein
MKDKKLIS